MTKTKKTFFSIMTAGAAALLLAACAASSNGMPEMGENIDVSGMTAEEYMGTDQAPAEESSATTETVPKMGEQLDPSAVTAEEYMGESSSMAGEQQLVVLPDVGIDDAVNAGYTGISPEGRVSAFGEVAALARCSFGDEDPTIGATNSVAGWYTGGWGGGAQQALVVTDDWVWYAFQGRQSRECNRHAYRIADDGTLRVLATNHILYKPGDESGVYRSEWARTFGSGAANGEVRRIE